MTNASSRRAVLAGRIISAFVVLFMAADGTTGLLFPQVLAKPMAETGFAAPMLPVVGLISLASALLYAVPRTAALGAILLSGFLGGAIAVHVAHGQLGTPAQLVCLLVGVAAWGGLWLRDARLRALLPFRG